MALLYRDLYDIDIPVVLGLQLRAEDQVECRAASGMEPEAALSYSMLNSNEVKVIVLDGKIVGLFGLAAAPGDRHCAAPWMLAGDELFSGACSKQIFSRRSKDVVDKMLEKYPMLTNYVAVTNVKAIRWLAWLGFSFAEKTKLVDPNVEFVRFWKGEDPCALR